MSAPVAATATSPLARAKDFVRRYPVLTASLAGLVVLILVLMGVGTLASRRRQ